VKIRVGVSVGVGPPGLDGIALASLAGDLDALGFDSIWLPEVLTSAAPDPLIGLAWAGASNRRLKLGTTMLLPGRHLLRLAKQIAVLDQLTDGRFLLTLVPGLVRGPEREAVGVDPGRRGEDMDERLPVLRRLLAGEPLGDDDATWGAPGTRLGVLPKQDPFDMWFGGRARRSLVRCGRLADGWLPSLCSPTEAAAGKAVVEASANEAGRTISPEHFGVSIVYATAPLDARAEQGLAMLARGRPIASLVPVGLPALVNAIEAFVAVGFSKFVVRPVVPPEDWHAELVALAPAVVPLQT